MTASYDEPSRAGEVVSPELTFFAACPRNVSDLLAGELRGVGIAVDREHPAGVSFSGPLQDAYRACLYSRTASRVVMTLAVVDAPDPDQMYRALLELPWGNPPARRRHAGGRCRR